MNKQKQLDRIASDIKLCRICRSGKSGKAVPGEGNPDAEIIFIGEAPGRKEAETGRPFVGRSGQLLRNLIRETGLIEEEVFITSPVKYFPDRGTPTTTDIKHGRKHLFKQIDVINPKFIVLLGNVACKGVLGETIPVLSNHGRIIIREGKTYFITLHPAAVLRFPKYLPTIKSDFKKLRSLI